MLEDYSLSLSLSLSVQQSTVTVLASIHSRKISQFALCRFCIYAMPSSLNETSSPVHFGELFRGRNRHTWDEHNYSEKTTRECNDSGHGWLLILVNQVLLRLQVQSSVDNFAVGACTNNLHARARAGMKGGSPAWQRARAAERGALYIGVDQTHIVSSTELALLSSH
jgi:hypothetical protein